MSILVLLKNLNLNPVVIPLMTSESFNGTNTILNWVKRERVLKNHWRYHKYHVIQASGQREKSKLRRKLRDRRIKAKLLTNDWFQDLFAQKPLPKFDNLMVMATIIV